jgi:hypothetical protein
MMKNDERERDVEGEKEGVRERERRREKMIGRERVMG